MKKARRSTYKPAGQVAAYLAMKELQKLVTADFAALPDPAAFWRSPEFERIHKELDNRDRLSLKNVLSLIDHCPHLHRWLKWHHQVSLGTMTLAEFVKKILFSRHSS